MVNNYTNINKINNYPHFKSLNVTNIMKYGIWNQVLVLDRHKNVVGLNRLNVFSPTHFSENSISNDTTDETCTGSIWMLVDNGLPCTKCI
jgi:hypothetical protein